MHLGEAKVRHFAKNRLRVSGLHKSRKSLLSYVVIGMRKITAYILLFLYINGLLTQVSPIINDVLAHTFWRMNHLATVHCVNGKYHVHYELYKAGNAADKKGSPVKSDETYSFHIQPNDRGMLFTFNKEILFTREGVWLQPPVIRISGPPPKIVLA
jgi:hypothetical protein